ncbi:Small auxin-up RNA [Sesbania bispinosa]|nr:Small auxin-up RNA [Sesbania bispinosa]
MTRSFVGKIQKSLSLFVPTRTVLHLNEDQQEIATSIPDDVLEGHFVVLATNGEESKRFVVKLDYLSDPAFLRLLDQAREEFGFRQKGALAVPFRPQELQKILHDPRA